MSCTPPFSRSLALALALAFSSVLSILPVVRQLSKMLKRRTSVNHLFQAACLLIHPETDQVYSQMFQVESTADLTNAFESVTETANIHFLLIGVAEDRHHHRH